MKKVGQWLKAAARYIALGVGILAGTLALVTTVRKSMTGKVSSPQPFTPVEGAKDLIDVETPSGVARVQLPKGINTKDVVAVEVIKGGPAKVEVLHEAVDRRSMLSSGGTGSRGE